MIVSAGSCQAREQREARTGTQSCAALGAIMVHDGMGGWV